MGVSLGVNFLDLVTEWEKVHSSGVISEGPYVEQLEAEISKWSGLHAIAVNSAGSGLYMMALALKGKMLVAVASNTFYATGAMFRHAGHDLVLVDCNREDFSMSFEHLSSLDPKPEAVVLTHVGGSLAKDYHKIALWCEQHAIVLFEDGAHVLGTIDSNGHACGHYGLAGVFSLYPTKSLPAGEGGIIVTANEELADWWRIQRSYAKHLEGGVMKYGAEYPGEPNDVGFNFRMDEWTGVVALAQWKRRDEIIDNRQEQAAALSAIFGEDMIDNEGYTNWYKYPVRKELAQALGVKRFAGAIYSRTDQLQIALKLPKVYLPNSTWVADNHVCLPLYEGIYDNMTKDQILAYLGGE